MVFICWGRAGDGGFLKNQRAFPIWGMGNLTQFLKVLQDGFHRMICVLPDP
jgi:hypothetical protein